MDNTDDLGSEINTSQNGSVCLCLFLFLMQRFPNYTINMQSKLDQIVPLLILV